MNRKVVTSSLCHKMDERGDNLLLMCGQHDREVITSSSHQEMGGQQDGKVITSSSHQEMGGQQDGKVITSLSHQKFQPTTKQRGHNHLTMWLVEIQMEVSAKTNL